MKPIEQKIQFRCLGTTIKIILVPTRGDDQKTLEIIGQKLKECFCSYQDQLSRFEKSSEVGMINQNLGKWISVSPQIKHLAKKSFDFYKVSNGVFDPRIIGVLEKLGYDKDFSTIDGGQLLNQERGKPFSKDLSEELEVRGEKMRARTRIDFTGIAKGFIVDKAAKLARKQGIENFLIDAGGDMFVQGKNALGNHWHIAVEGYPEEKLMLILSGRGIATTGISRKRWLVEDQEVHHLIDVSNPDKFSFNLKSVTVVSDDSETADGWAKVLFILGKKKGLKIAEEKNIAALFLDKTGNVFHSSKLKPFMNLK